MRELMERADAHCRLATLRFRGWLPWRHFVMRAYERRERAAHHAQQTLLR